MVKAKSKKQEKDLYLEVAEHRRNLAELDGSRRLHRAAALGLFFILLAAALFFTFFR